MLKPLQIPFLILLFIITLSFKNDSFEFPQRNTNVCKRLSGNVLVYLIFTETKESSVWADYDIASTLDSVRKATKWIESQAKLNNVDVRFTVDYYQGDSSNSVYQRLGGIPIKMAAKSDGLDLLSKWSDKIIKASTGEKTKEALITNLRNKNATESVALLYMLNNFYKTDYALSFNTATDELMEYSFVSSKLSNLIAQEILHLFGAPYLYEHPSVSISKKSIDILNQLHTDDVMAKTDANLDNLKIGSITSYSIGWTQTLDDGYLKMLKTAKAKF